MTTNGEVLNLLKRVGLNQYESRIYSALLESGTSTAGELSELADVPRSRVYDVLTGLEKKGFAITQIGRPLKYIASPPENVVGQIRSNYEKEYKKNLDSFGKLEKNFIKNLAELYTKGRNVSESEELVGILKGKTTLYNHMKQLIDTSKRSVIKVTNEEGLSNFEKHCRGVLDKANKRGIKIRVIANVNSLNKDTRRLKDHIKIRKLETEGRFFVKDGKEAILVTSPEHTGLWVKSPYLASTLEKLFDHAWEKGETISV